MSHTFSPSYKSCKEFRERDLSEFKAFAILIDTVQRGSAAFAVALGIDTKGRKKTLVLGEGATENHDVAKSLLSDLESRGLNLHKDILFITDGGGGIIRSLKELFGKDLLHQRLLQEAQEEVHTLHRLNVPELLGKALHSTNAIESMFPTCKAGNC